LVAEEASYYSLSEILGVCSPQNPQHLTVDRHVQVMPVYKEVIPL